jgi:colanic acid/amylovoran biosynthesis glycosyltransferase
VTTLFVFTRAYPYKAPSESSFLAPELTVLRRHFDRIVIVPSLRGGALSPIEEGVVVDGRYAAFASSKARRTAYMIRGLVDRRFLREFASHVGVFLRHPSAFRWAISFNARAQMMERWMRRERPDREAGAGECIFYTWWFEAVTLGLAAFAKTVRIPVVTRAHGYDLFEERQAGGYIPFRAQALDDVSRVFPDSAAGVDYMRSRYPQHVDKIQLGRLGIPSPDFRNEPSRDGVFRIVSCSMLVAIKRIDLLIRGLVVLGRSHPTRAFHWTHVGSDGPLKQKLRALAAADLPPNVQFEMLEYPGTTALMEMYRTRAFDVFVNVSSSEGTPMAIIEAISVGIPVVATAVGGNSEIVSAENGMLLDSDPTPDQIGATLARMAAVAARSADLRDGSYAKWTRSYSAETNYDAFSGALYGAAAETSLVAG